MDPITLIAAIIAYAPTIILLILITFDAIAEWFAARGQIKGVDQDVIAFTLAERIANRQYATVSGVFSGTANTQMVQGFYNQRTGRVVDGRALSSSRRPDESVVNNHAAGNGLVIYT
jgi:hypothetical protein